MRHRRTLGHQAVIQGKCNSMVGRGRRLGNEQNLRPGTHLNRRSRRSELRSGRIVYVHAHKINVRDSVSSGPFTDPDPGLLAGVTIGELTTTPIAVVHPVGNVPPR